MLEFAPKVVFFDWNKTLSYSRFWEQLEDERHPLYEEGKKIEQFLFKDNRNILNPWMRGKVTTDEVLDAISQGTGILRDILERELLESCRNMQFAFKELPEMITALKGRGIQCVIATDNMDTFRKYTISNMKLDDLFDNFLISCELGMLKFDIDRKNETLPFFDHYLAQIGLRYHDSILLDDHIDDGYYASKGFRIFQVRNSQELRDCIERLLVLSDSKERLPAATSSV